MALTFIRKLYRVSKPRNIRLRVGGYFTLEQDFLPAVNLFDGRFLIKNWTPAKSKHHHIQCSYLSVFHYKLLPSFSSYWTHR